MARAKIETLTMQRSESKGIRLYLVCVCVVSSMAPNDHTFISAVALNNNMLFFSVTHTYVIVS